MPYITKERREKLQKALNESIDALSDADAGDLNYFISSLIDGIVLKDKYSKFNEVMGVLSCVGFELYRRVIAPYEGSKLAQNGEVYTNALHRHVTSNTFRQKKE